MASSTGLGRRARVARPPDRVLDTGYYDFAHWVEPETGEFRITLHSQCDSRTGLSIVRTFWIPGSGNRFRQRTTLINSSKRHVRWAPWEVVQIPTDGAAQHGRRVIVETNSTDPALDLGSYFGRLVMEQNDGVTAIAPQAVVAKRGWPNASGSIGCHDAEGRGIRLEFEPAAGEYPDGGSRVELWMQSPMSEPLAELDGLQPSDDLVEIEVLGPLAELAPADHTHLDLEWVLS